MPCDGVAVPLADCVGLPDREVLSLGVWLCEPVAVRDGVGVGVVVELSDAVADSLNDCVGLAVGDVDGTYEGVWLLVSVPLAERLAVTVWLAESVPVPLGLGACDAVLEPVASCDLLEDAVPVDVPLWLGDGVCVVKVAACDRDGLGVADAEGVEVAVEVWVCDTLDDGAWLPDCVSLLVWVGERVSVSDMLGVPVEVVVCVGVRDPEMV